MALCVHYGIRVFECRMTTSQWRRAAGLITDTSSSGVDDRVPSLPTRWLRIGGILVRLADVRASTLDAADRREVRSMFNDGRAGESSSIAKRTMRSGALAVAVGIFPLASAGVPTRRTMRP